MVDPRFRILLIEDDEPLARLIAEGLGRWGYEIERARDFRDIPAEFERASPHLVVMDVNLPHFDGFFWCRRLRESSKVPVLFLSARAENMDVVMGVSVGGDDYLTKPFSMEVLIAKVRALLRRAYSYAEEEPEIIQRNGAVLDLRMARIENGGASADLTRNEFRILSALMARAGSPVPKEDVMEALWRDEVFVDDNTLNVAINRLRKKLASIGLKEFVVTRKGEGYIVL